MTAIHRWERRINERFYAVANGVPNTDRGIVASFGWTLEEAKRKREADIARLTS